MRLIKPSFEIWDQQSGLEGIYKQIERVGRVCYKSEDKITEDSAKPFVERMVKSGHGAMLEHGTVYLKVPNEGLLRNFIDNTPSHFNYGWCRTNPVMDEDNNVYITTNYRHIIEHKLEDYLKYLCEPTEYHEKRVTVRFICDRGVSHEFVRHRVFSFAQESTRYCNYSKDKFGNELTFIIPCWSNIESVDYSHADGSQDKWFNLTEAEKLFINSLRDSQRYYLQLTISNGWKPQQARAVLPNALKTELVMTGFVSDWKHFFDLRCASNAHPQARELAIPLSEEFVKRGYINSKNFE